MQQWLFTQNLMHPHLTVDVSDHSCDTVLEQHIDNMKQPLAFFGKQFLPPRAQIWHFRQLITCFVPGS